MRVIHQKKDDFFLDVSIQQLSTHLAERINMAVIELTKELFESTIQNNDIVLIDFWAEWCGPCLAFAPTFEAASEQHPDVVFAKVNTEQEFELAAYFNIRSIPTLIAFREQIGVFGQPGALPPQTLEELISSIKKLDMDAVREENAKQADEES